jgi:hypothetical protein
MTPKTTKPLTKAAPATTQARAESGRFPANAGAGVDRGGMRSLSFEVRGGAP